MSGDYKLGELLYQATLNKDFVAAVEAIKTKYAIPKYGYSVQKEADVNENMVAECYELQVAYGIPHTNPLAVYHYVLYGVKDWDKYETNTEPFYIIEHTKRLRNDIEDLFQKTKQPYVKLLIPEYANQDEVKQHLTKVWPEIQRSLQAHTGRKKLTVRRHQHKNRDQLIRNLAQKSKEELRDEFGEEVIKGRTKELMLASILKQHFGYKVSPETVKKVTSKRTGKK